MINKARILIVDDNEINRDTLEGLVEALGHVVIMAENGREALELIRLPPQPDLVLLDLLMPEMNGDEVLQFIKKDKSLRSIPVIMISVVDELEAVVQCIEVGAEDYLTKPFNVILLKARINACLEKKRAYDKEQKFNFWLAESYQKLQKAENDREAYFNMIVHDINNPLNAGMLMLEMLLDCLERKGEADNKLIRSLGSVSDSMQQIKTMAQSILEIAKMENGQVDVQQQSIDGMLLLQKLVAQFAPDDNQGRFKITLREIPDEFILQADRKLLLRVMQNLIANAVKHGLPKAGGEIVLAVERHDGQIIFSVSDNGPGIAEEHLDKVFQKFYQVDRTQKGQGLGLNFCKMAVEAMGGEITVINQPQGGASFSLLFPCSVAS